MSNQAIHYSDTNAVQDAVLRPLQAPRDVIKDLHDLLENEGQADFMTMLISAMANPLTAGLVAHYVANMIRRIAEQEKWEIGS